MKFNRLLRHALLALIALATCWTTATAAAPGAPQGLQAMSLGDTKFRLTWTAGEGGSADGFSVWMANGITTDPAQFSRISKESMTRYNSMISTDSLTQTLGKSPGGTVGMFWFTTAALAEGDYSFYVTAENGDGVGASPIVHGSLKVLPALNIVSRPQTNGWIGSRYLYRIETDLEDTSKPVTYMLLSGPGGNDNSGFISGNTIDFIPENPGRYTMRVQAFVAGMKPAVQEWELVIGSCTVPGVVTGTVKDDQGNPATDVKVTAVPVVNIPGTIWYGEEISTSVENGSYNLSLESGSYLIYVSGDGLMKQYYPSGSTQEQGRPIMVACSTATRIDFNVEPYVEINYHSISGTVTDAASGDPIEKMMVLAYGLDATGRTQYGMDLTDANGNYTIEKLPDVCTYIVQTRSEYDTASNGVVRERYLAQFYDHVPTREEATSLTLTGDLTGIDFGLTKRGEYSNGVSGVLQNSTGAGISGRIVLLPVSSELRGTIGGQLMTETDGTFSLENVAPGDYIVYGIPESRSYVAAYYNANGTAVTVWADASLVTVSGDAMTTGVTVILSDRETGGTAKLSGVVSANVGRIKSGGSSPQSDKPVSGAGITIVRNGVVADQATSDALGRFELTEVPSGTVTVIVDKPGYDVYRAELTIDEENPLDINVPLSVSGTSGVEREGIKSIEVAVSPNPIISNGMITFEADGSTARVHLVDVMGREVRSFEVGTAAGRTTVELDVRGMASGIYYVRVMTAKSIRTVPVEIVR